MKAWVKRYKCGITGGRFARGLLLTAFLALFLGGPAAHAACTDPAGAEGAVVYNNAENVLQYCDSTQWVAMVGGGGGSCSIDSGSISYQSKVTHATNLDTAISVEISPDGTKAYTLGQFGGRLGVYDISGTPSAPAQIGVSSAITQLADSVDMILRGNYIYAVGRTSKNFVVVDVSNPAAPAYVTSLQSSPTDQMNNIWSLALSENGQYAFTVSYSSGASANKCYMHAIDISNPAAPSIAGTLNLTDAGAGVDFCNRIRIKGNIAYVTSASGALITVNIATPASMTYMNHFTKAGVANQSHGMAFSEDGNYVFTISYSQNSLNVWNISNPNSISWVTALVDATRFGSAHNIEVKGHYAFVTAEGSDAFTVVDVSNPGSPVVVDSIIDAANLSVAKGMEVRGQYAYVADYGGDSLVIIDLGCAPASSGALCASGEAGKVNYNAAAHVPQFCNGTNWVSMVAQGNSGTSPYSANAVHFDDATYLNRGGDLSGIANGKKMTGSLWFRRDSSGFWDPIYVSWPSSGGGMDIAVSIDNKVSIETGNSSDAFVAGVSSTSTYADTNWHHLLFSFDVTGASTANRHFYVDGVNVGNWWAFTDDNIVFSRPNHRIGASIVDGNRFYGDLADVWIDIGTYIDFSVAANREKFIDSSGYPVNLGSDGSTPTGTAPDIFLSGTTAGWDTNKGTGGGFTETGGSLTDAASSPSDGWSGSSPCSTEGAMIYNADYDVLQYCDGAQWIAIGK